MSSSYTLNSIVDANNLEKFSISNNKLVLEFSQPISSKQIETLNSFLKLNMPNISNISNILNDSKSSNKIERIEENQIQFSKKKDMIYSTSNSYFKNTKPRRIIFNCKKILPDEYEFPNEIAEKKLKLINNKFTKKYLDDLYNVTSINILVENFLKLSKNQMDAAWFIYYWITHNISYGVNNSGYDPESVFKNRKAICGGYANLFKELANLMKLECETISGHSRSFDDQGHAWNSIKIENKWFLIDSTWGAGVKIKNKWNFNFDCFYFLTNPNQLINSHFPNDSKYQFLNKPLNKEEFLDQIKITSNYYNYGIELLTKIKKINHVRDSLNLSINVPENISWFAKMQRNNAEVENSIWKDINENGTHSFTCLFENKGSYEVQLFAKSILEPGQFHSEIIKFDVIANGSNGIKKAFPLAYSIFSEKKCELIEPKYDYLKKNDSVYFEIKIPDSLEANIIVGETWNKMNKVDGSYLFSQMVEVTSYEVSILAKFEEGLSSNYILKYKVK